MIDHSTYERISNRQRWRPWLINQLTLRPQIAGREHAERVADRVLETLRHFGVSPSRQMFNFQTERAVRLRLRIREVTLHPSERRAHARN